MSTIVTSIDPQGVTLVEPGRGMEMSYEEILLVAEKMGIDCADKVYRGSDRYLERYDEPVESAAAAHLIETARFGLSRVVRSTCSPSARSPMWLRRCCWRPRSASASWWSGRRVTPPPSPTSSQPSFNMEQDMLASQLLFDSGVPLVYLPGFHVGAQLGLSLPEVEAWVKGRGEIGDYSALAVYA